MTTATTTLACVNCMKPATRKLTCPICKQLGINDSVFCTTSCYKENWGTHKEVHERLSKPVADVEALAPGTFDPFDDIKDFKYTGTLRAQYPETPVPKRTVPESIPKPDYAVNNKGISFREKVSYRIGQVHLLSKKEAQKMRHACHMAREVLDETASHIRPGVTPLELDEVCHEACVKRGGYPSPLGYREFPRSVCTSVNEIVTHGIPDARPLKEGDIINLDVTIYVGGYHGDVNATYPVGNVDEETQRLITTTREALDKSIAACKPGVLFRDIGPIIEEHVRSQKFSVIRSYTGHGIHEMFHCPPNIPHYKGNKAVGAMKAGMCFTIEPMVCAGTNEDLMWPDDWTAVTADGRNSAQFEETLLVTPTGVEVLTAKRD